MIEVLSKISSILYFIIKIYTIKNVSCYTIIQMYLVIQYKIIITKYLNIAIAFHQTRACARDCSKKWRLQYISQ